ARHANSRVKRTREQRIHQLAGGNREGVGVAEFAAAAQAVVGGRLTTARPIVGVAVDGKTDVLQRSRLPFGKDRRIVAGIGAVVVGNVDTAAGENVSIDADDAAVEDERSHALSHAGRTTSPADERVAGEGGQYRGRVVVWRRRRQQRHGRVGQLIFEDDDVG